MLPLAALYQALFDSGVEAFVHFVLASGALLLSLALRDFGKVPKRITWIACVSVGAEALIFLVQGVSLLVEHASLNYFAFTLLGQRLESALVDVFLVWCMVMVLRDSQGRTRILGFIVVPLVIGLEAYKIIHSYLGGTSAESLKLIFLSLFVWLLLESRKKLSVPVNTAS
jgi:hypothetical protein